MSGSQETEVVRHYAGEGLEARLIEALVKVGKDPAKITQGDLSMVDEFHIGGRRATVEFAAQLPLRPGMSLLDVGCGVGGPARYFAAEHGCRVTGVDLTPDFVAVATALAARVGLSSQVDYRCASALDLPFETETFDGAYMLHVGMNIEDKAGLFAEVRRVLKPGGFFALYDVMRAGPGALPFPLPWASDAGCSFVEPPETYARLAAAAGFELTAQRERSAFARQVFAALAAADPAVVPRPVLVSPERGWNLRESLANGLIAPVEMIFKSP